jgi:hypothetical protein
LKCGAVLSPLDIFSVSFKTESTALRLAKFFFAFQCDGYFSWGGETYEGYHIIRNVVFESGSLNMATL